MQRVLPLLAGGVGLTVLLAVTAPIGVSPAGSVVSRGGDTAGHDVIVLPLVGVSFLVASPLA